MKEDVNSGHSELVKHPVALLLWFGLAGHQVTTKAALSLPLLNWTREKKHNERLVGRDKDRECSPTSYRHRQNRLDLGKLVYEQSNWSRIMRNKPKS